MNHDEAAESQLFGQQSTTLRGLWRDNARSPCQPAMIDEGTLRVSGPELGLKIRTKTVVQLKMRWL